MKLSMSPLTVQLFSVHLTKQLSSCSLIFSQYIQIFKEIFKRYVSDFQSSTEVLHHQKSFQIFSKGF